MNGSKNNSPVLAWTWVWDDCGFELNVSKNVSELFDMFRQHGTKSECGGQLFIDLSYNNGLWLSYVTLPHPSDKSSKHWVELNSDRCKFELNQAEDNGLVFAGYWHTHPQIVPTLSNQDKISIQRFYAKNKHIISAPIFIIVGTSSCQNGIRAWAYKNENYNEGFYKKES
jgi:proteasome lid subunit RPN8/RPN11